MKNRITSKLLLIGLLLVLISGCMTHPYPISPKIEEAHPAMQVDEMPITIGYYISEEKLNYKHIGNSSSAGDVLVFYPYKEFEDGYDQVLSKIFKKVIKLPNNPDQETMEKLGIDYVVIPTITTESGGTSFVTWPPTYFKMELSNSVFSRNHKLIATVSSDGDIDLKNSDKINNRYILGAKATEEALYKMPKEFNKIRDFLIKYAKKY